MSTLLVIFFILYSRCLKTAKTRLNTSIDLLIDFWLQTHEQEQRWNGKQQIFLIIVDDLQPELIGWKMMGNIWKRHIFFHPKVPPFENYYKDCCRFDIFPHSTLFLVNKSKHVVVFVLMWKWKQFFLYIQHTLSDWY